MSYYKLFGLEKEPFSTSPDPQFLYRSPIHDSALKRIEIAIRLRRGLSLIIGDVGTGKTTLSRALLQAFKDEPDFLFHMILDPSHKSEFQFLLGLVKMFGIRADFKSAIDFKESIERYLFQKGAEENKTIVLLIDECQTITTENLEVLRTLLNYETNEFKLLQLVMMAQVEILPRVKKIHNFMDRISLKYTINPLDETETKEMINFRLRQAGYREGFGLFTDDAIKAIYQKTQGYPRKISILCHNCLEEIVMKERAVVDEDTVNSLLAQELRI